MKDRLRQLRESLGYSQADFAAKIGVAQGTVSKWEAGSRVPSEIELRGIAQQFSIRLEWLKTGDGDMKQTYDDALEQMALILFRQLNEDQQASVLSVLKYYLDNGKLPNED